MFHLGGDPRALQNGKRGRKGKGPRHSRRLLYSTVHAGWVLICTIGGPGSFTADTSTTIGSPSLRLLVKRSRKIPGANSSQSAQCTPHVKSCHRPTFYLPDLSGRRRKEFFSTFRTCSAAAFCPPPYFSSSPVAPKPDNESSKSIKLEVSYLEAPCGKFSKSFDIQ